MSEVEEKQTVLDIYLNYETRLTLLQLEQERFDRLMLSKRLEFQKQMGEKKYELFKAYSKLNKLHNYNQFPDMFHKEYLKWFNSMSTIAPSFPFWS